MTYLPHPIIRLKSYITQLHFFSHLVPFYHRYNPFFILASTQIQSSQPISTSSLQRRSPICHGAVANQARMLEHKLIKRLLVDQRLSDLLVV